MTAVEYHKKISFERGYIVLRLVFSIFLIFISSFLFATETDGINGGSNDDHKEKNVEAQNFSENEMDRLKKEWTDEIRLNLRKELKEELKKELKLDLSAQCFEIAEGYSELKKYEKAIEFYKRTLDNSDYRNASLYNIARMYALLNNWEKSVESLHSLYEIDSTNEKE